MPLLLLRWLRARPGHDDLVTPRPIEKQVVARVRLLLHSVGVETHSTQQTRPSRQARGLPDLWCMSQRTGGFWLEVKRPGGKQSPGQVAFQHGCARANIPYVLGGLDEVVAFLMSRGILASRVATAVLSVNFDDPAAPSGNFQSAREAQ